MKAKNWLILALTLMFIGVGGSIYTLGHRSDHNQQLASKTPAKQKVVTPDKPLTNQQTGIASDKSTVDIRSANAAGLFQASFSRNLNNFSPWQESPVTVDYADFNGDGTPDAFVWAKLPGTQDASFAAVWTTDATGTPQELWHLPSDQYLSQSSWSLDSQNELINTGRANSGSATTDVSNVWKWQTNTTNPGFVLEPNTQLTPTTEN